MAYRRPFPPWMLLDRFVRRRDDDSFPANDPTAASLTNSRGDPFDVCLCSKKPPHPSSVYLRWPNAPEEAVDAAAAHGGAVLLLMHYDIPVRGGRFDFPMIDYVVYDPAGPSLRLLPSLLGGSIDEVKARAEADKLHVSKVLARRMESFDIGIIHRGPGDFAVAELQVVADAERSAAWPELRVFNPSISDQWVLKMPRVVPVHPRDGLDMERILLRWDTDAVVPVGERLCWVDYTAGVMFCNVFDERYEISFLEMPVELPRIDRDLFGRGWLEAYHGLGATKEDDVLKFARVLSDDAPPPNGTNRIIFRPQNRFVVTIWSVRLALGNMVWKEEGSVTSDQLRDFHRCDHLPQEVPMYPMFSLDNPDIVRFVLTKDDGTYDHGEIWLVDVNVMNSTVESSMLYIKDKEDWSPEEAELFERKMQYFQPFLPVEMPNNTPSALYGEMASTFMETLETKPRVASHLPVLEDQPVM